VHSVVLEHETSPSTLPSQGEEVQVELIGLYIMITDILET